MIKECIALFVCGTFLLFSILKGWGRRYAFRGTTRIFNDTKAVKERYPGSHEEECRAIFESYFKVQFKRCRPSFLKNKETNRNLELDGFAPNIITSVGRGVAFEYNGPQHYSFDPKYHKTERDFEDMVRRDALKEELCKKNGVILIVIPPHVNTKRYIRQKIYQHELYIYL